MTDINNETDNPPTIALYNEELRTITAQTLTTDILQQQAESLNALFENVLHQRVWKMLNDKTTTASYAMEKWLSMTLKIQKQTIDTAKAACAIEYMNGLNHDGKRLPLPLMGKNEKTK